MVYKGFHGDVREFINVHCSDEIKERFNEMLHSDDLDERMDICDEILTYIMFEFGHEFHDDIEDDLKDYTLY